MEFILSLFGGYILIMLAVALIPCGIAMMRGAHNTAAITVLGVVGLMFFGIGWLIALIWAFVGQTKEDYIKTLQLALGTSSEPVVEKEQAPVEVTNLTIENAYGQVVFSGLFNQNVINTGVDIIYGASEVKGEAAYVPITAALLSLQQIEPLRTDLNTVVVHERVLQREEYN